LALNFFCFFGIGHVWCTVRQRSTRNKVDLVLNASEWWQLRGNFTWKTLAYSCKMLVTIGGSDCYISCNEINASLHIMSKPFQCDLTFLASYRVSMCLLMFYTVLSNNVVCNFSTVMRFSFSSSNNIIMHNNFRRHRMQHNFLVMVQKRILI
jgi:hypothetical protein